MKYTFEKFTAKERGVWTKEEMEWLKHAVKYCRENRVESKRYFAQWCIQQGYIIRPLTGVYQKLLHAIKQAEKTVE